MKALVAAEEGAIAFAEVDEPRPARDQALIAVEAIGLNRGDLRMAATMKPGFHLGWDFAGRIVTPIRGGEPEGARVAGLMPRLGAWGERIAAPADCFAAVPEGVPIEVAAVLPSAGLTALYALEDGGPLLGRRVLVTGASGGVGHLACQLAAIGGATVTALVRSATDTALFEGLGLAEVAVGEATGAYDLVLDSVGGETLAGAIGRLARGGLCIAFGVTGGREAGIDVFQLYQQQRRLSGFGLFPAIAAGRPARAGLERLLALVAQGRLKVEIGQQGRWEEIADIAGGLAARAFKGKAVMRVQA
jgi:NADPH:quinone reductase